MRPSRWLVNTSHWLTSPILTRSPSDPRRPKNYSSFNPYRVLDPNMDPELYALIQATKTENPANNLSLARPASDPYTHMSLWGPHHRWTIRTDQMATFWRGYCDLVDDTQTNITRQGYGRWSLAERPQDNMPVVGE